MISKVAIQIRAEDQVATAAMELLPNEKIAIHGASSNYEIVVNELIPAGHKVALRNIDVNEEILKYGEVIGAATSLVPKGHHVHMHNCVGLKARRFSKPNAQEET